MVTQGTAWSSEGPYSVKVIIERSMLSAEHEYGSLVSFFQKVNAVIFTRSAHVSKKSSPGPFTCPIVKPLDFDIVLDSLWAVLYVILACGCGCWAPFFASWSALSFPAIPTCAGIHWSTT